MASRALICGLDGSERATLDSSLRRAGWESTSLGDAARLLETLADPVQRLLFIDARLLSAELGARLREQEIPTIALCAQDTQCAALERGAHDVLARPLERESVALAIARAERLAPLFARRELAERADRESPSLPLVARSPAMRRVHAQIERVASAPRTTVLLLGERGSGRESIAREIQRRSPSASGPFVVLRCDRRLASTRRWRVFDSLEAGTIYLDAIDMLAFPEQEELACWLRERGAERRARGVRLVAASARDLARAVGEQSFREDLFYRLNVFSIAVPALAQRRDDLVELAEQLLSRRESPEDHANLCLSAEARSAIEEHSWPGNLRELEAAIERACWLAEPPTIEARHLGLASDVGPAAREAHGERTLAAVEAALIRRVIREEHGNKLRAARALGINRATLYNKLRVLANDA